MEVNKKYFLDLYNECSDYKDKVLLYGLLIAFALGVLLYKDMLIVASGVGLSCEILGANATKRYAELKMNDEDGEKFAKWHDVFQWGTYVAWFFMLMACVL